MVEGRALMGFSGGGMNTLYTAALDQRITVAVISGYFSHYRFLRQAIHCDCNYLPRILEYADMPDVGCLIAPRPLLIVGGTQDPIFPQDGVVAAFNEVVKAYRLLGVEDRLEMDIFEGGHRFNGAKSFGFIERWLH
jgi:pimeloyl-ACP methyl ester carboxylesterase